jgi:2-polyprenyl-3-methyl-5-hydroxy-6-metoxy-1,4-benzoquinol methylase
MKDKWNERYSSEEYFFGKEPNDFLKEVMDKLTPGKALFIGEGEGRNSVYAASNGWIVDAIDVSDKGKAKAEKLAQENGVNINYQVSDAISHNYPSNYYDAVSIIYFHVNLESRNEFEKKIIDTLKPNGTLILLVYDQDHLKNKSNGPSDIDLLYTLQDIAESFIDLKFIVFKKEHLSRVKKGKKQESTVLKFVGVKI